MTTQVQIFTAKTTEELQQKMNEFCIDFFPEEIINFKIAKIPVHPQEIQDEAQWLGYIVYKKSEY
ncbi:hypothetical protein [Helicobacter trogontum]|uniref:Uncharacterized protein n=1 Tax=Helicobacter trogontum TaxID=50960 RepID=A0A099VNA7_9HELI|nr:hypothetical protein [Helicobacter trogontum]MCI5787673.1 hypothetical protein [Helicobacter trogontum]MDY5185524.1 hypothetical protein [Helicobacter trogontum]TLD82344.1 hypothetical protein LS81_008105 [Helicobacter trogontum]TLD98560.1 hypothetical protein LS80_004475 [Helicobacter trogontum]